jgi:hypothetical protein
MQSHIDKYNLPIDTVQWFNHRFLAVRMQWDTIHWTDSWLCLDQVSEFQRSLYMLESRRWLESWKAAANEIVMMSTEAMPMVAVESLIFSASFSSFGCLGSSSSSPRGRKPGLAPAALSRESILTSGSWKVTTNRETLTHTAYLYVN